MKSIWTVIDAFSLEKSLGDQLCLVALRQPSNIFLS